mgnify:CR=1 FL=1
MKHILLMGTNSDTQILFLSINKLIYTVIYFLISISFSTLFFQFYAGVMGYGAAEATGLGFVCFVAINPCVLLANRVDLGFFVL